MLELFSPRIPCRKITVLKKCWGGIFSFSLLPLFRITKRTFLLKCVCGCLRRSLCSGHPSLPLALGVHYLVPYPQLSPQSPSADRTQGEVTNNPGSTALWDAGYVCICWVLIISSPAGHPVAPAAWSQP